MAKVELTIERNYRPNWGYEEGVRELLQNAKDAEVEHGARMNVEHTGFDTLVIENVGAVIDREALLLGHTSKAHREDLIGQFGDGLKIGILALIRDGYGVKIRNGGEVWQPYIDYSEKFKSQVLMFDISTNRKIEKRIRIEIKGITFQMWENLKCRFLFLQDEKNRQAISSYHGELMLDKVHAGKIYVKGILVQTVEGLSYGYNLTNANVDIERKIVDSYDRGYAIRQIWRASLDKQPELMNTFVGMLENSAEEFDNLNLYNYYELGDNTLNNLVKVFKEKFGDDAVPVNSLAESQEATHYGKRGVILPKAMLAALQGKLGNFDKIKESLKFGTIKKYSVDELSIDEVNRLNSAMSMLKGIRGEFKPELVDVVDFRSNEIKGTCQGERIQVSKEVLGESKSVMRVLVHELAHAITGAGDGDKRHIAEIESIWSDLFGLSMN